MRLVSVPILVTLITQKNLWLGLERFPALRNFCGLRDSMQMRLNFKFGVLYEKKNSMVRR